MYHLPPWIGPPPPKFKVKSPKPQEILRAERRIRLRMKMSEPYSIGVFDGRERFIHPPESGLAWKAWRARWEEASRKKKAKAEKAKETAPEQDGFSTP